MNKKVIISFIIIAAAAASFFFIQNDSSVEQAEVGTEVGETAPDFSLPGINSEEVKLSDYRGKKVFLNFWATWCPPCRAEMPDIQRFYEERKDDIVILAVNIGEEKGKVVDHLNISSFTFPVVLDRDKSTASEYLVRGIPTSYFIDKNGTIINKVTGAISYQQMLDLAELD